MSNGIRRRTALALLSAVAAAVAVLAPLGAVPTQAQSSPIQHIVVLDLENHSFDNVLGFWCQAATLPGGVTPRCGPGDAMPASVTLSNGARVTPYVMPDVVPSVNHSMTSQLAVMDGGKMDGWQKTAGGTCAATTTPPYQCIGGYTASQLPNITALAGAYPIEDRFFSLKDSPSWGGHMYAVAATTDGFTGDNPLPPTGGTAGPGWGCDSNLVARWAAGGPWQPSCVPDFALNPAQYPHGGAFEPTKAGHVPTIMDSLDTAGLSWRIYGEASTSGLGYEWSVCPTFADCLDTSQRANLVDSGQFLTDAAAGALPAFSLITAGGSNVAGNCHNGFSMTACDNYVGQVAQAVLNSPEWSSTALFITWDDYGGFYDSQRPAVNPDGTQQGIRLPLIVVSPYAQPAATDSTPATFASILAFTEHTFGLPPLGTNDSSAYGLSGMFNLAAAPRLGHRPHMATRPVPRTDHIQWQQARQGS
jgi:phospholipase C